MTINIILLILAIIMLCGAIPVTATWVGILFVLAALS